MPTFTYPGVYVEEIPSGVHTITGVATSIAAFAGWAPQGPTTKATLVQSWHDYATQFGGLDSRSYLGYAVNQFFGNGGQQTYIVRLTDGADRPAALTIAGLVFDSSAAPSPSTVTIIPGSAPAWQPSTAYSVGDIVTDSNGGAEQCTTAGYSSTTQPTWPTAVGATVTDNSGVNPWAATTAYAVDDLVTDTNGHVQRCTTAGTSGAVVPAWPTTPGATTADGSAAWTLVALGFADWKLISTSIPTALPWQGSTAYSVGTIITDSNGGVERCTTAGYSSTTQPTWPTAIGMTVTDNSGVNPWAATTAYTAGTLVTDSNGHVQRCTTAGTSGATQPTWPTAVGATTTDATVVWTLVAPGFAVWDLIATSMPTGGLTLTAANSGDWGNNYSIQIQPRPDDYTRFALSVVYTNPTTQAQSTVESYANLSLTASDPQYVVNIINESSSYLVASMGTPALAITQLPAAPATPLPSTPPIPVPLALGDPGAVLEPTTTPGSPGAFEAALLPGTGAGGVYYLSNVPIFNILCVPGEIDPQTIQSLQKFCVDNRAFMVVDCEQHASFQSLQNGPDGGLTGVNAINSALYFPWVNAFDFQLNRTRPFPPCGFVAGIYAATDASRNVWKAPAGIDASLTGESGLSVVLTDLQNGTLNVQGINCLRNFRVYGDVVWGSRTLRGSDQIGSESKYVPIRRFTLFLESSLYEGTQWVVFEPNDETLWGQIRLNVGAFMQGLFLQGAFAGSTPQKAYFVKCDGENNPPPSVAQGIVNIMVGFAPLYPAEFVVIQIQQIAQTA